MIFGRPADWVPTESVVPGPQPGPAVPMFMGEAPRQHPERSDPQGRAWTSSSGWAATPLWTAATSSVFRPAAMRTRARESHSAHDPYANRRRLYAYARTRATVCPCSRSGYRRARVASHGPSFQTSPSSRPPILPAGRRIICGAGCATSFPARAALDCLKLSPTHPPIPTPRHRRCGRPRSAASTAAARAGPRSPGCRAPLPTRGPGTAAGAVRRGRLCGPHGTCGCGWRRAWRSTWCSGTPGLQPAGPGACPS